MGTAPPTADPTPPPTPPPTADPTTWKPGPNETPVYNIKYTKKWPHCSNVGACIKGSKCALEAACNAAGKECTGFSFTTGAVVGNGCLKKCGNAEFGGFGTGTHDYYAKGGYTVCKASAEETQLADIEEGVNAEATWGSRRRRDRRRRYWDRRRRTPSPTKMTYPPIAAMSCGKVDLALVIDASGSVNAQQWEKQMGFARALVKNMGISSSSVNAGIVMFGRTASTKIGLTSNAAALMPHLMNRNGVDTGATNMVAALDHADKMLKRGRSGVPKVMMMLTDGEPNRGGNPDANFAAMKAAGTSVMMVLIGPGISSRRAKNWGSTPPISISSFTALSSAFTTISKEFCSVAKEAVKKAKTPAPTIAPPKIPTSCECHTGTAVIPQANAACPKDFKPTGKPCPGGGTCCGAGWTKSCGEGCAKAKCDAFKGEWIPLDYKTNPYTCKINCPEGFKPTGKLCPGGGACCGARWTKSCGEGCAKAKCDAFKGVWIPLDYKTNPYTCETTTASPPATKPPRITKHTFAFGGNGGGVVNSNCADGHYVNWWRVRSGSLVDRIQGRCSNGAWLRACGGSGGGENQRSGVNGAQKMYVRTGALVDQFNGRGGNGGGAHWLDCGSGFKITGYQLRCGSLVD